MSLMENLRVRIGLESDDTSKDEEITLAKGSAFALMGNYCDRLFPLLVDAVEVFTHTVGMSLALKRYPIVSITSVLDKDGTPFELYHANNEAGILDFDVHMAFHQVTVTFEGGYDEDAMPADLLMAFYSVFDQEYALVEGGAATTSSGDITSVTVVDVGTIRYDTSSEDSEVGGAFLPDRAKSLLEAYKRYRC